MGFIESILKGIVEALTGGSRELRPSEPRSGPSARPAARRAQRHREPRTRPRLHLVDLEARLGVPAADLRRFEPTYREFRIRKRSGGERRILAPDPATKAVQRRILHRLLDRLPAHEAARGFERGQSIVTNASPHARRAVVLKMDLEDFFAATSARRIARFYHVIGWDPECAAILVRLTTHSGGLPAGAPTSPRLANLVNVRMDARLAGIARALHASYTRYADDITFSFQVDHGPTVHDVIRATKRVTGQTGYRLHLHRKLEIRRQHERQVVTGLVVNDRVRLPRARRRWLRAVEHHLATGRMMTLTPDQLAGWRSLAAMIERRPDSTA